MAMMNKREIATAFAAARFDEVSRECQRYGTITRDHSYDVQDGRYAGAHRLLVIEHHDITWTIRRHNGNVVSIKRTH